MIIAVAVVKNLAQNLRDSKNMADMQSKGKKINKQACFRESRLGSRTFKNGAYTLFKNFKLH